jgi:hypothetical protein
VNPASAGRRVIARPDTAGDWAARCIATSRKSTLTQLICGQAPNQHSSEDSTEPQSTISAQTLPHDVTRISGPHSNGPARPSRYSVRARSSA